MAPHSRAAGQVASHPPSAVFLRRTPCTAVDSAVVLTLETSDRSMKSGRVPWRGQRHVVPMRVYGAKVKIPCTGQMDKGRLSGVGTLKGRLPLPFSVLFCLVVSLGVWFLAARTADATSLSLSPSRTHTHTRLVLFRHILTPPAPLHRHQTRRRACQLSPHTYYRAIWMRCFSTSTTTET